MAEQKLAGTQSATPTFADSLQKISEGLHMRSGEQRSGANKTKATPRRKMQSWMSPHWPEMVAIAVFVGLSAASLVLPFTFPTLGTAKYAAAFNAALSIGTGGVVSFLFYYLVNVRLERRHRNLLRGSVQGTYREAKQNIALAVIHASQKGGRRDLSADITTINQALTMQGFKSLFEGGHEGDEGYYAFQNEMSSRTPEYDEIVFNLKVIARAAERLIDSSAVEDRRTYEFFVRLSTLVERIERNGPGYEESKPLCSFIWEIFAGWNFIDGDVGYDPIERTIQNL